MERSTFDDYIDRFNARDETAFEDYIDSSCVVLNGSLVINGAELHVERFVSDDESLAIQMWTHFGVKKDDDDSPFGPVKAGESFDFHGVIMYQLVNNKFTDIKVSYLSFSRTDLEGNTVELGIPH
jgi:lantibiotic modifying enzyme